MNLKLRKAFIASALAAALPMSLMNAPNVQASPDSPPLSQEASYAITDPAECATLDSDEPVAIPYAAVAAAEELIANGAIDDDIVAALNNTEPNVIVVGPQPRVLPAMAALAVAGVAWCAKGPLSSLVPSVLQELVHQANSNIPPPDWVMGAIFGCVGGPVLGALTSQAMRLKFAAAVLAVVIKLRNYG